MNKFTLCLLFSFTLLAQPVPEINRGGVVNVASFVPDGVPNAGIAQGSLFAIFGRGLGPAQLVASRGLPLPTMMEGVTVRITAAGTASNAPLIYVSAGVIAAVLPSATPLGEAALTVTFGARTSPPTAFRVVPSAFGIFTRNSAGFGPAILQNFLSAAEVPRLNSLLEPARPGQIAVLWGTGLGAITGSDAEAPPVGDLATDVEVLVGGVPAPILYKGRAPGAPGQDQINFAVPPGPEGCYVPVVVRAGGRPGNYATMAIGARGGRCEDATSFSAALLDRLAEQSEVRLGVVELQRYDLTGGALPTTFRFEDGAARFLRVDGDALRTLNGLFDYGVPPGMCTVYAFPFTAETSDQLLPRAAPRATGLDAGRALTVRGPRGVREMLSLRPGVYEAHLGGYRDPAQLPDPLYLDPGEYALDNGSGGGAVGGFRATQSLPPPVDWTNRASLGSVPRNRDLTVNWTGGAAGQFVVVAGSSARLDPPVRATFVCTAPAAAGRFTVPASILASLPATGETPPGQFPLGLLMVGVSPLAETGRFTAPGLDLAQFHYLVGTASIMQFP